MTDNSTLPVSVGTEVFANDDIGGVHYPRVKLVWGADGVANDTANAAGKQIPVTIDTSQLGALVAGGVPVVSGGNDWLWIDVSQTNTTLPSTVTGSYLEEVLCIVATPATSQVQIKDGSGTARTILPNAVAGGVGSYPVPLGLASKLGAWQISTGAGVTVIASFHV